MAAIVDTHTLVWFLKGQGKVDAEALKILRDTSQPLVIPSIVLAEVKYLVARGRVSVTLAEVIKAIEDDPRCVIYPLDSHVIHAMPIITDIHDGIICGTALLYRDLLGESVKILTRDGQIRKLSKITTV